LLCWVICQNLLLSIEAREKAFEFRFFEGSSPCHDNDGNSSRIPLSPDFNVENVQQDEKLFLLDFFRSCKLVLSRIPTHGLLLAMAHPLMGEIHALLLPLAPLLPCTSRPHSSKRLDVCVCVCLCVCVCVCVFVACVRTRIKRMKKVRSDGSFCSRAKN